MDSFSSCPSYDYPWQATFSKISLHFRYELLALKNSSGTVQQYVHKKLTDEAKLMIFIIYAFFILSVIGTTITAYDNYYKQPKKRRCSSDGEIDIKNHVHSYKGKVSIEGKKGFSKVLLKKFKAFCNCFCIYTNGRRILSTVSNDGNFLWLHGIRFIGAFGIIAMHVAIFYGNSFSNLKGLKPWMNTWLMALILNGSCMISVFFVLSGFLNGYYTSRFFYKSGGTISWVQFYWKRFERILPLYALILGFYATLFSYTGSGPLWPTYDTNPVCKKSWWWNLFFINNYQTSWKQCYTPAWYVAVDMQLYILSPLFLVSLFKRPKFGYGLITLGICASCFYRCVVTIKYGLFYNPSGLRHYLEDDEDLLMHRIWMYMDTLFTKPIPNLGAYLTGLGLGHYILMRELSKKGSNSMLTLCFGWIGFAISMWICFDVLYFSEESYLKHISYNGFSGILSSLALAWIFYICATKQWGLMIRFLSIKAFLPLSRLSYASYLINFIVLLHYLLSSTKQAEAFSFLSMFVILFYVTFWTYIISFIVSLFFEAPMSRVLRWIHDY